LFYQELKRRIKLIIKTKKYIIATNQFPLEFSVDGTRTDEIEHADFFDTKSEVLVSLDEFDCPEDFQMLEVEISYKF
jgi:hypothetical protein